MLGSIWVPSPHFIVQKLTPSREPGPLQNLSLSFSFSQRSQFRTACCSVSDNSYFLYLIHFSSCLWQEDHYRPFYHLWQEVLKNFHNFYLFPKFLEWGIATYQSYNFHNTLVVGFAFSVLQYNQRIVLLIAIHIITIKIICFLSPARTNRLLPV